MLIAVGSTNILKIEAAQRAFQKILPQESEIRSIGIGVDSGVRRQPFGDRECIRGARNRAYGAAEARLEIQYGIGLESGICEAYEFWFNRGWAVVYEKKTQKFGIASTSSLILPFSIVYALQENPLDGLGSLLDRMLGRTGIKYEEGYTGIVTGKLCDRKSGYVEAIILACAPFINPGFFEMADKKGSEAK